MNNSINYNYGLSVRNNNLGFYGKKKVMQNLITAVTNPAVVTGEAVTAAVALSQLVKHDTKSQKIESNLAKVPDSVEEMKARLAFNTPANLDELKDHVKYMENFINRTAGDIAATRYLEFTGVNTPESMFTLYEPGKDGKYHVTKQTREPDYSIISRGGKYDLYYDKNGIKIGETRYNSKTNKRVETWVKYHGISIRKDYNPDGTVKGYLLNDNNSKILKYDANGEVLEIDIRSLPVKNTTEKIAVDIERIPSEFAYLRNESKWTTDENGNTAVEFKNGKYMYKGQVDYVQGLVDVVKLGKAAPPKTE